MRKIIGLFLLILVLNPLEVKANIVCNDGTISPSCSTCHKGCCSRHGGCSGSSSSGSSSSNSHSSSGSSSSSSTNKNPVTPEIVKSSDTSLKKVTVDDEDIIIADNMVYSTTNDNVMIIVVATDSKATVDYQNKPDLTIGENVINIKVTAENGNVKNYKLNITKEKVLSANKNIKIFVAGQEIIFKLFASDIVNIANDQENLDITYELEDPNAHAEIIGNENLQVGYNEVIVRVTAENGEEQDYILLVEKAEDEKENKEDDEEIKEEEETDIQKENPDDKIFENGKLAICVAFGSSFLLGVTGYLIYNGIKKTH